VATVIVAQHRLHPTPTLEPMSHAAQPPKALVRLLQRLPAALWIAPLEAYAAGVPKSRIAAGFNLSASGLRSRISGAYRLLRHALPTRMQTQVDREPGSLLLRVRTVLRAYDTLEWEWRSVLVGALHGFTRPVRRAQIARSASHLEHR
jgi:hypothetical protein